MLGSEWRGRYNKLMRFSQADMERWVASGLITSAQRDAMAADLTARPERPGLDLTTLLYYGGGLLVLLAYSIFLGLQWEEMNSGARIAISAASMAFFAIVAQVLMNSGRFRLPGELLQVVAAAIVPLFVFALLDAAGWWPDEPGYRQIGGAQTWENYQSDLIWARMALGAGTLLAAGVAFWLSRSPFVLIAAIVAFISLTLDATLQVQQPGPYYDEWGWNYDWGVGQSLTVAAVGGTVLVAAVLSRGRSGRDYAVWLYVVGLAALAVGLGSQALDEDGAEAIWGTLWMVVALAILGLSLVLQERLFAAAGLAAMFAYFGRLVFEVFESANAALALVVLGMIVLSVGMLYQRYNERLFSRPAAVD